MVIIKEIQNEIEGEFGGAPLTPTLEDEISSYIYVKYPGDYYVTVDFPGHYRIVFTFTTPADELLFRLTHL